MCVYILFGLDVVKWLKWFDYKKINDSFSLYSFVESNFPPCWWWVLNVLLLCSHSCFLPSFLLLSVIWYFFANNNKHRCLVHLQTICQRIAMTALTETNVSFQWNKETRGTSFQKKRKEKNTNEQLDLPAQTYWQPSSLSVLFCLYSNIVSTFSILNHVHCVPHPHLRPSPPRHSLLQVLDRAWLKLLSSIHSKWWKSVSRPTGIPSKRLAELKYCLVGCC